MPAAGIGSLEDHQMESDYVHLINSVERHNM